MAIPFQSESIMGYLALQICLQVSDVGSTVLTIMFLLYLNIISRTLTMADWQTLDFDPMIDTAG